nr:MAG TPA: hypothetical protein [Caudoviricetes sp.]
MISGHQAFQVLKNLSLFCPVIFTAQAQDLKKYNSPRFSLS